MAADVPLSVKVALATFGILVGLAASELALRYLVPKEAGSEFSNVSDLQAAMLRDGGPSSDASPGQGAGGATLREIINPHPNQQIIYDLRPDLDLRFQRSSVVTNSCGMRDDPRPHPKPPNTYRIAMLGDSFAFGWGVEVHEATAKVLEQTLTTVVMRANSQGNAPQTQTPTTRFEVLNFGVPGYSTFQQVALFRDRVLEFEPDAVIVFFVENDFGPPFFLQDFGSAGGSTDGLLASASFFQLARRAVDPRFQEHQLEIQGLDPNRSLEQLSDLTRERGIRLVLFPNPKQQWVSDRKRLPILRKRPDIQVADIRAEFNRALATRGIDKAALTLSFDPHPSPLKHQLMGELLAPYFLSALSADPPK
jgi:hypothetical protein